MSRRFRLGSIRLEKSTSSFWRSFLASRRVGSRNGEQPWSKFFSRHACAEGALQCCRGDGSSFSFSIEGAPHYRHCGKIILTRLDGPPSSFSPTGRVMPAGCLRDACRPAGDACGMRRHPGDACGMPAGMPAGCLRVACGMPASLQASCSGCLRDAQASSRHPFP